MTDLQVVSLFAGIGGIDRGLELAGASTALLCEKDQHARNILARHFPAAAIHNDVTELTADDCRAAGAVPGRTVLTAGWPCQGNSVAGARRGMDDPRSGLWPHVVRLLAEHRPAWFIGENVPGLLSVNDGRDFSIVVHDLARLGYGFTWRILDARHFGVPQRRRRVVIVGRLGDTGAAAAQVLLEPEGVPGDPAQGITPRSIPAGHARTGAQDAGLVAGQCHGGNVGPLGTLRAGNGSLTGGVPFVAHEAIGVLGNHAHTLTGEGHDASEDGPGRGTPIIGFAWQAGGNNDASGAFNEGFTPTLPKSQTLAVAYAADYVNALDTAQGGPDDNTAQGGQLVAFALRGREDGALPEIHGDGTVVGSLRSAGGGSSRDYVAAETIVRRLSPLECERLQGFPDDWTEGQADSHRYKQLGNSVAVPVFEWVGRRLVAVDNQLNAPVLRGA